ncbi:NUDIX hydrolase [Palleronia sp.]|uniref:NUDIX hydrolase n=1 Tax=Palleronia sp. TaxID=1940284 RepID=UPI0035C859F0
MGRGFETVRPIDMADQGKRDMRAQFAALPWRRNDGRIEVLLVTTRDGDRWVIPKGWPMDGKTPAACAATEAYEEAGVIGVASERCVGVFTYRKRASEGGLPVIAAIFPLEVTRLLSDWDERKSRRRKWVSPKKAARLVSDPELARVLSDPTLLTFLR